MNISEDALDHTDDFNADGSPNRLSLREANDYLNRYYRGGDFNDFENSYGYVDRYSYEDGVYQTIQFAGNVQNCFLDSEILVMGGGVIEGKNSNGVNVTVQGSADNTGRLFNIQDGFLATYNLNFANTFARANASEPASIEGLGGAVYVAYNTEFSSVGGVFSNNYAERGGGAVCVAEGGHFAGTDVEFRNNYSLRGGAIANYGAVSLSGENLFELNEANGAKVGLDPATARGFGGAIYNAGWLMIGFEYPEFPERTTFSANKAFGAEPISGSASPLLGGSGGAIYNTLLYDSNQDPVPAHADIYKADFANNVASKYGGAIGNFGWLSVYNSTFASNTAASGGAIQNSLLTSIDDCAFSGNAAEISPYSLVSGSKDFGGNGGAIFTSGAESDFTIQGETSFSGNTAENAGGAIDYINGVLEIFEANVAFTNNRADVIGGAIVAVRPIDIAFPTEWVAPSTFQFIGNDASYAPTVAVTCNVGDDAIGAMAQAFFPDVSPLGRELLDTFVRYGEATSEHKLTFEALAESFTTMPNTICVNVRKVDQVSGVDYQLPGDTIPALQSGSSYVIEYYSSDNPNVIFRSNIQVLNATTSVVASQINLSDRAYIVEDFEPNLFPAGISLRVYSTTANPISQWIINWGEGANPQYEAPVNHFGFTYNAYHPYSAPGVYPVRLKTVDSPGSDPVDYGVVGCCVVKAPAPAATLQEELFADEELLDDLFVEF